MAEKELWNIAKEKCWKTEEPHLKEIAISCGNIGLCMKKNFSAAGCERMWKEEKQKWRG